MSHQPLVSCIMPTYNRRAYVPRAIAWFLRQTYSRTELVVLDDGEDAVQDLIPADPRVRYVRLNRRLTVGRKRNLACEAARGELIAHWDDDDWYAPDRLETQVAVLSDERFDICGVDRLYYFDLPRRRAFQYRAPGSRSGWMSMLCYRRSLWSALPFPEVQVASDTLFLRRVVAGKRAIIERPELMVCTIHRSNVSPKRVRSREWRPIAVDALERIVGADWKVLSGEAPASVAAPAEGRSNMKRTTKNVGILSVADPRKGLWRDTECLLHALSGPGRRCDPAEARVTVFASDRLSGRRGDWTRARAVRTSLGAVSVAPGTSLMAWLNGLDVLVVVELLLPEVFDHAQRQGVRVVHVPNLDWAEHRQSVDGWVRAMTQRPWLEVWAKTPRVQQALRARGIESVLVPWSVPDRVERARNAQRHGTVRLLVNAGNGGWRGRRAVDVVLRAFERARARAPQLMLSVKSIRSQAEIVPRCAHLPEGVTWTTSYLEREQLETIYAGVDGVVHVSRWEGFGLPLLESLHRGLPVIATDGWPMNELVEHEHNGLLVPASQAGHVRLAPHWEVDEAALADAMVRFAAEPQLRERLTCPEPGALVARQLAFALLVRQRLLATPPPRVVLLGSELPSARRRAEAYWAAALGEHGYEVDGLTYDVADQRLEAALRRPHDFVLMGKVPVELLQKVKQLSAGPLVVWHHDLIDFDAGRAHWFEEVRRVADLCCIPEAGREAGPGRVRTLLPGPMTAGDRGPGRRPIRLPPEDCGPQALFIGDPVPGEERVALLRQVGEAIDLCIAGDAGRWRRIAGLSARGPAWDADADALHRAARTVLSVSRGAGTPGYTSSRLFNAAAVGACVVARRYPGIEDHFPAEAIATFADAREAVQLLRALLADPDRRTSMRRAAETHVWRHHGWLDRVACLLAEVDAVPNVAFRVAEAGVPSKSAPSEPPPAGAVASELLRHVALWDDRAARHGERAVAHIAWSRDQFEQGTRSWWALLSGHLEKLRRPSDRRLLDFGCGAGRFSRRLVAAGFEVEGVDLSAEMLRLARAGGVDGLGLHHLTPGEPLPFEDSSMDALWSCTVLQHVPDAAFGFVLGELRRVLRPGALVILLENTHRHSARTSRSGHVVFRAAGEYLAAFPGLRSLDEQNVLGEAHSILAGRLNA